MGELMMNLTATCLDTDSNDELVLHRVTSVIDGRPMVVQLYASDPPHAIQRAMEMPQRLWRLDVEEVIK